MAYPIAMLGFLTIGNYSFLRYSSTGLEHGSLLLLSISYLRLVIPLYIILYAFWIQAKLSLLVLKHNFDVILMGFLWLVSSLLSADLSSYLLYGVWTLTALIAIVLYISFTAVVSLNQAAFLRNIFRTLWFANLIILFLDLASLWLLKPVSGIYTLFFATNSFWAYPTTVMGILALIHMRFVSQSFRAKIYYLLVFMLSVISVYHSARRSPLFCLILTPVLIYLPLHPLKIALLLITLLTFSSFLSTGSDKALLRMLPESYTKYRIERMLGHIQGKKETSYAARKKIWKIYLRAFREKPVLGQGLAATERIAATASAGKISLSAHNTFIGSLAETGLAGALLFMLVIGRSIAIVLVSRQWLWIKIYIILLIPTLAINWVEYNLTPGQIFFLYSFIIWLLPRGAKYLIPKISEWS